MNSPLARFSFPTAIIFGPGTLKELPGSLKKMGLNRPLVVTDPGLLSTSAFGRLKEALGDPERAGWVLCHQVHPNPLEEDVAGAAKTYVDAGCDSVVAFGGGSALDVGKALRLLVRRPGLELARFSPEDDWSGLAPCVCIPTTAGTGSEVGRSSVITLAGTHRKAVFFHPELLARLVILDPELTRDLPPFLTAATGLDALTHCIESFTSPVFHPFCDGIALEGIHLIRDSLPRAFEHGDDLEARGRMLVAASMGAVAFQKDLGATHSLAHPLSTLCGVHHGTANAICLPHVMAWNAARRPGLYRRVGVACGLDVLGASGPESDQRTVAYIKDLLGRLDLPGGLRDLGVQASQVDALADQAIADSCHLTNPVPVTRDDLKNLYLAAL